MGLLCYVDFIGILSLGIVGSCMVISGLYICDRSLYRLYLKVGVHAGRNYIICIKG